MSQVWFVSDIHLSTSQDPAALKRRRLFLELLEQAQSQKLSRLVLLGDIFDLWIADRRFFIQNYSDVVEALRQLIASGCRVDYFEGNHDLDLQPFWGEEMGCQIFSGPQDWVLGEAGGWRFRVEHGDQMDPSDRGYIFLRWLLRTPLMIFLGRHLPNMWVSWIGERASLASREYTTSAKGLADHLVRAKIHKHAKAIYPQTQFNVLVTGHVHVAMAEELSLAEDEVLKADNDPDQQVFDLKALSINKKKLVINLGTWLKQPRVLQLEDGKLRCLAL